MNYESNSRLAKLRARHRRWAHKFLMRPCSEQICARRNQRARVGKCGPGVSVAGEPTERPTERPSGRTPTARSPVLRSLGRPAARSRANTLFKTMSTRQIVHTLIVGAAIKDAWGRSLALCRDCAPTAASTPHCLVLIHFQWAPERMLSERARFLRPLKENYHLFSGFHRGVRCLQIFPINSEIGAAGPWRRGNITTAHSTFNRFPVLRAVSSFNNSSNNSSNNCHSRIQIVQHNRTLLRTFLLTKYYFLTTPRTVAHSVTRSFIPQ